MHYEEIILGQIHSASCAGLHLYKFNEFWLKVYFQRFFRPNYAAAKFWQKMIRLFYITSKSKLVLKRCVFIFFCGSWHSESTKATWPRKQTCLYLHKVVLTLWQSKCPCSKVVFKIREITRLKILCLKALITNEHRQKCILWYHPPNISYVHRRTSQDTY